MTTMLTSSSAPPAPAPVPSSAILSNLYRMTVDQYDRLVATGVLDGEPIELIDGLLVRKMGKKPPHVISCEATRNVLLPLIPPGWRLAIEAPVRIPDYDEPEPDLAVIRGTLEDYEERHPGPHDIGLLIEVSDSTLERDRGDKQLAYARGGVGTYWVVNLVDRQLEIYTEPTEAGYRERRVLSAAEEVAIVLDGREVGRFPVAALLPRR
jgi:Uma2 family endonuclease